MGEEDQGERWDRILVFVATQRASEHVAGKLAARGVPAAALHGGLSQDVREQRLRAFSAKVVEEGDEEDEEGHAAAATAAAEATPPCRVLVATDVAGRGLDVKGLSAVVNYDLPRSTADYVSLLFNERFVDEFY